MYRLMKGSTCSEINGRDIIANTSTSGFPDFGEIRPHPKTSWAISEELTPAPVLIYKKLRLDVVAKRSSRVLLYRKAPAALALHDAGDKPATRLCTRQSFLLIVRTQHIVTVPPTWDGIVAWDTRMSQHIAEFCNSLYVDRYSYGRRLPGLSFAASNRSPDNST